MAEAVVATAVGGADGSAYACLSEIGGGGTGSAAGGAGDVERGRSLSTSRPAFFFAFLTNPLIVAGLALSEHSVNAPRAIRRGKRMSAVWAPPDARTYSSRKQSKDGRGRVPEGCGVKWLLNTRATVCQICDT